MLCHPSGHLMLPTQPLPREAEDFPRDSKHVSLLTCLAQLQPVINNLRLICKHVKTRDVLLGVKCLIKKHKVVATLISTHESASYAK